MTKAKNLSIFYKIFLKKYYIEIMRKLSVAFFFSLFLFCPLFASTLEFNDGSLLKIKGKALFVPYQLGDIYVEHDSDGYRVVSEKEIVPMHKYNIDKSLRDLNNDELIRFLRLGYLKIGKRGDEYSLKGHVRGIGGGNGASVNSYEDRETAERLKNRSTREDHGKFVAIASFASDCNSVQDMYEEDERIYNSIKLEYEEMDKDPRYGQWKTIDGRHQHCFSEYDWIRKEERVKTWLYRFKPAAIALYTKSSQLSPPIKPASLLVIQKSEYEGRTFVWNYTGRPDPLQAWDFAIKKEADRIAANTEKQEKLAENIRLFPSRLVAAQGGDAVAQNQVGCAYYRGEGIAKNVRTAREWFEKSATQGNMPSMAWLAYIYQKDEAGTYEEGPIHVRRSSALMWYRRAIDLGGDYQACIDQIIKEAREGGYLDKIR